LSIRTFARVKAECKQVDKFERGRAFANEGVSGFPLSRDEEEIFFCFDRAVTAVTAAASSSCYTSFAVSK